MNHALIQALKTAVIHEPTEHIDTLIKQVRIQALKEQEEDNNQADQYADTNQIAELEQRNQNLLDHNNRLQSLNERFKQEIDRQTNWISAINRNPERQWTDTTSLNEMIDAMAKTYGRTSIIPTIKLVRAITSMGLKEAKDRVDPRFDSICPKPSLTQH